MGIQAIYDIIIKINALKMKITIGMQNSIHLDLHREDEYILHELAKTHRSVLACNTGHLITIHTGGIYKICMGKPK